MAANNLMTEAKAMNEVPISTGEEATQALTKRPTVPAIEGILGVAMNVLDHGFVRVVDYMGSDDAIVQAARVSYGKGTKTIREDAGLIKYLLRNWHTSPFEMCEIKFHVKLPIFVARQWVRHRTANINEYSARYSVLDREFYIPDPVHVAEQSSANRQGRGDTFSQEQASRVLDLLRNDANRSYDHYLELLNEDEDGNEIDSNAPHLARELARMNLSLNFYTQWYWKVDLHNWMGFLKLRSAPHAQLEIRLYAQRMLEIMKCWVPHTYAAFEEYRLNSVELSGRAAAILRRIISGEKITAETSGLSRREWQELKVRFFP
jgi:thymidylate synthase (FAD)